MEQEEPQPRTFYTDRRTGGLFYFLGKNKKDYVFDAVFGQRIMRQPFFAENLIEVENVVAYIQEHPAEGELVKRVSQSPLHQPN